MRWWIVRTVRYGPIRKQGPDWWLIVLGTIIFGAMLASPFV